MFNKKKRGSVASRIDCHTTEVVGVGIVHAEMKKKMKKFPGQRGTWELCSRACVYLRAEKKSESDEYRYEAELTLRTKKLRKFVLKE